MAIKSDEQILMKYFVIRFNAKLLNMQKFMFCIEKKIVLIRETDLKVKQKSATTRNEKKTQNFNAYRHEFLMFSFSYRDGDDNSLCSRVLFRLASIFLD